MLQRLKKWLVSHRVIYCKNGPGGRYLERWGLRLPFGRAIYLHNIVARDHPVFHDHPWSFVSIVLRGGYTEVRADADRLRGRPGGRPLPKTALQRLFREAGSISRRTAKDAHYISHVEPNTWTLVLRGKYRAEWGFYPPTGGWVHWRDYLQGGQLSGEEAAERWGRDRAKQGRHGKP